MKRKKHMGLPGFIKRTFRWNFSPKKAAEHEIEEEQHFQSPLQELSKPLEPLYLIGANTDAAKILNRARIELWLAANCDTDNRYRYVSSIREITALLGDQQQFLQCVAKWTFEKDANGEPVVPDIFPPPADSNEVVSLLGEVK